MRVATLVSWLLTAALGSFMLHTWLDHGGLRRARETPGGLPPALIFGHAAGAFGGLLLWIAFLAVGARPLAWAAVAALMVTVGLGLCTVTLWTPYPARRPGERRSGQHRSGEGRPGEHRPGEHRPGEPQPGERRAGERREEAVSAAAAGDPYQVTDEMIVRLLSTPYPAGQSRAIRPNPAVLVPIAHGFAAIGTFVLAVTTAIT